MKKSHKIIIVCLCLLALVGIVGAYAYKMYNDVVDTSSAVYKKIDKKKVRKQELDMSIAEPFSILLLGVDTEALGRTDKGFTDTMMLLTVSPQQKKTTIVSIPKDSYVKIAGHEVEGRLNTAYSIGNIGTSVDTIQNFLTVPIDYYVKVNMGGIQDLIDAIDGIQIENGSEIEQDGIRFGKGLVHLNGEKALAYARAGYNRANIGSDYTRQQHQRQIVSAIAKKMMNVSTLTKYKELLRVLQENTETNFKFDDFYSVQKNYKQAFTKIDQLQLQGTLTDINAETYQIIDPTELSRVSAILSKQLESVKKAPSSKTK
ncbi:LCP family protein [Carnobacterium maltaromaticum]|uniref:LCP family protein n=1 Tax=Carnobacterium maltaromaticum TaxID=2751 RepID=A0AAW9K051_CARML|nr:LCP family protein [Carnobacterium maltaromaticum]MDZ5759255.1 LCP family protein [Carnobacterium maltaromaticum]